LICGFKTRQIFCLSFKQYPKKEIFLSLEPNFQHMPISAGGRPTPSYRKVMIFIDGGYLREYFKKKFGNDEISLDGFQSLVYHLVQLVGYGAIKGELIRTYYYDATVDETEKERRENQFFRLLHRVPFCTVKLGRLIKTADGYRQKGVDILMAIDMLTKASENHYDIAILVAGDGDFVELVEAVKDSGKRVYGAYIPNHVSSKLSESFDVSITLTENLLKELIS
jgi:uncharacterized LabA/DUF88 family protein